jgi:Hg(II)-responsive transcriptional regulator
MSETRTIGKLARDAGVHVETVRYYERRGLLRRPLTPLRGVRHYDEDTLASLRFIKRAQSVGFSLEEIRELLALRESGRADSCERVREKAEHKLAEVDAKLRELAGLRQMLAEFVGACEGRESDAECPILAELASQAHPSIDVVILHDDDCPSLPLARAAVGEAARRAEAPVSVRELPRAAAPIHWRGFASPTVLVAGHDVVEAPPCGGTACRVYTGDDGRLTGAPPVGDIVAALERARA